MKRLLILSIIFLLLLSANTLAQNNPNAPFQGDFSTDTLVIAVPLREYIKSDTNYTYNVHVYNSSGFLVDNTTTSCKFHLYNLTGEHTIEDFMTYDSAGTDYYYIIPPLGIGVYDVFINCNGTQGGYVNAELRTSLNGETTTENSSGVFMILLLIPLFLAFVFLVGGATLGSDHNILKIFLYLLCVPMIWISTHWGMIGVIKYYNLVDLQNSVGDFTFWTSIIFIIIITYFIFYWIYKIFNFMQDKKDQDLKY